MHNTIVMPEPEDCIEALSKWIQTYKNQVYDENIKAPNNDNSVLANYQSVLESIGSKILRALDKEDITLLTDMKWPTTLLDCVRDPNTKIIIRNEIEQWFIRFPFVRSRQHLEELEKEYEGVNS